MLWQAYESVCVPRSNMSSWCSLPATATTRSTTGALSPASWSRSTAAARRGAIRAQRPWSPRAARSTLNDWMLVHELPGLSFFHRFFQPHQGVRRRPSRRKSLRCPSPTREEGLEDEAGVRRIAGKEDRRQLCLAQTPQMFGRACCSRRFSWQRAWCQTRLPRSSSGSQAEAGGGSREN